MIQELCVDVRVCMFMCACMHAHACVCCVCVYYGGKIKQEYLWKCISVTWVPVLNHASETCVVFIIDVVHPSGPRFVPVGGNVYFVFLFNFF